MIVNDAKLERVVHAITMKLARALQPRRLELLTLKDFRDPSLDTDSLAVIVLRPSCRITARLISEQSYLHDLIDTKPMVRADFKSNGSLQVQLGGCLLAATKLFR